MYIININSVEDQLSAGPEAVCSMTDWGNIEGKNARLLTEMRNIKVFIVDSFKAISVRGWMMDSFLSYLNRSIQFNNTNSYSLVSILLFHFGFFFAFCLICIFHFSLWTSGFDASLLSNWRAPVIFSRSKSFHHGHLITNCCVLTKSHSFYSICCVIKYIIIFTKCLY